MRAAAIATVWLKEVVENARDRRTLLSALVFGPLFGPALFAVMMALMLDRVVTEADEAVALEVSGGERAPNLLSFLEQQGVRIEQVRHDLDQARRAVRENDSPMVLLIPEEYPRRFTDGRPAPVLLVADNSDQLNMKYVTRVRGLLDAYGAQLGATRLLARGINPLVIRPVVVDNVDVSTPAGRSLMVLGMMTYFILFSMLMGGLYLTIDATAGERERGSLEVLFTAPAPRQALIYGKILAACAYMLLSLAITLAAFGVSLTFVPLDALGMSANLRPAVFVQLFLICAPYALFGAALMTSVAAFTRTYKEAQSYLTMVLIIPTLPILFAGLFALKPTDALMTVPSLSQHLLMTGLLREEPLSTVHLALSTGSTLAAGALLAWVAGRLYRREAILG
jgi:sodium transport system permease protein